MTCATTAWLSSLKPKLDLYTPLLKIPESLAPPQTLVTILSSPHCGGLNANGSTCVALFVSMGVVDFEVLKAQSPLAYGSGCSLSYCSSTVRAALLRHAMMIRD